MANYSPASLGSSMKPHNPEFRPTLIRHGSEKLHGTKIHEGDSNGEESYGRSRSVKLHTSDHSESKWQPVEIGEQGSHGFRVMLQTRDRLPVSPWNEIPLWTHERFLRAVCKTPRGKWAELEVAMGEAGAPLQLRMRKGQLSHYVTDCPWNVCMLPQTYADPDLPNVNYGGIPYDGNPLEVIEMSLTRRAVGEVYAVKVLGGFAVIDLDNGQLSWKLLAVDVEDVRSTVLHEVGDLHQSYPGLLEEVREWIRICYCVGQDDKELIFGLNERAADRATVMAEVSQAHAKWQALSANDRPGASSSSSSSSSRFHKSSKPSHKRSSSSVRPIPVSNPNTNPNAAVPPHIRRPSGGSSSSSSAAADALSSSFLESSASSSSSSSSSSASKLSFAVPEFLKARARGARPAFFENLSCRPNAGATSGAASSSSSSGGGGVGGGGGASRKGTPGSSTAPSPTGSAAFVATSSVSSSSGGGGGSRGSRPRSTVSPPESVRSSSGAPGGGGSGGGSGGSRPGSRRGSGQLTPVGMGSSPIGSANSSPLVIPGKGAPQRGAGPSRGGRSGGAPAPAPSSGHFLSSRVSHSSDLPVAGSSPGVASHNGFSHQRRRSNEFSFDSSGMAGARTRYPTEADLAHYEGEDGEEDAIPVAEALEEDDAGLGLGLGSGLGRGVDVGLEGSDVDKGIAALRALAMESTPPVPIRTRKGAGGMAANQEKASGGEAGIQAGKSPKSPGASALASSSSSGRSGRGGGAVGGAGRRVSWGWVEEVEIPSRPEAA